MPTAKVKLDHGNEALDVIVYGGDVQEHFRVAHEAAKSGLAGEGSQSGALRATNFVILSSILRGSRIKVGRTTRLRSAPGRSWEMMCDRTAGENELAGGVDGHDSAGLSAKPWNPNFLFFFFFQTYHCPDRAP